MISCFSVRIAVAFLSLAALGRAQLHSPPDHLRASTGGGPSTVASRSAITLTPEMRGDIFMARKMFREAIDKFREAPRSPMVENKIGIAYHQMGQLDMAKRSYESSLKMDKKFTQAINNLGTIYYSKHNYRKAMKQYRRALKLDPSSASIWVNLGSAYFAKRDIKHAAECYDKAMLIDPLVFEHRSHYGTLLEERTIEDRAKFHLYLAKAYAQRGDKERAIAYLRKALEEGVKERKRIPEMPEFASLKSDQAFQDLLLQDPKPL